jgi:outer membrane lipoprotein-sorting protein
MARAAALLASVCVTGCASAPRPIPAVPSRPSRSATLDEVIEAYDGYCKGLRSLSASGQLDVRDLRAGKSRRVGVRLVTTRGGRLYLKGTVAVITALEVVADGERFWFQLPSKKTVWTGDVGGSPRPDDDPAPYYALRPSDVTAALLPEPLAPASPDVALLESDRETFSVTLARVEGREATARRRVWLDRESLSLVRARSYDESGDVVTEVTLSDWTDGAARSIRVSRPREGYEAAFAFEKVQTNVEVPERAFVPRTPVDYKVVEVGKP